MRVLEPSGDVMLEDGEETRIQKRVNLYVGHRCDGTGMLLVTTRRVASSTPHQGEDASRSRVARAGASYGSPTVMRAA